MNKILIIQTAFIGDVVLATSVIEKLHEFYPTANIDFLLRKGNENLLKNHPKVNKVLIWDKKDSKYRSLFQNLKLVRRKKYDAVINIQRFFASGLITALSGSKMKVGFRKNPLSIFFTKKISHRLVGQHETSRNLSLITDLTNNKYVAPKLYPSEADYANVSTFQKQPYLCIAPTAVWGTKQFPALKWVEIILAQENEWVIYLLGGPADYEACEELLKMCERDNIINLAGKLSLLESAALIKDAEMNYVNDSAPMHIASAMEAKVNAIFCSTIPSFGFGPLSMNAKVIETEVELACKPCGLHGKKVCPLGHFDCAYTIDKNQFDFPTLPTNY